MVYAFGFKGLNSVIRNQFHIVLKLAYYIIVCGVPEVQYLGNQKDRSGPCSAWSTQSYLDGVCFLIVAVVAKLAQSLSVGRTGPLAWLCPPRLLAGASEAPL